MVDTEGESVCEGERKRLLKRSICLDTRADLVDRGEREREREDGEDGGCEGRSLALSLWGLR